jgi:hypothetical protein
MDSTEINPAPRIGQASVEAQLLAKRLSAVAMGETVTYGELSDIIKRDVLECRHILGTARRIAQREHGAIFDCRSDHAGIVRLSDAEMAEIPSAKIAKINRIASRSAKVATLVDWSKLEPAQQASLSATMSLCLFLQQGSSVKSVAAIQASATPSAIPAKVDMKGLLSLFSKTP